MIPPTCPRCGCPARTRIGRALVHVDAVTGDIVRAYRPTFDASEPAVYECGGRHRWTVEVQR